MGWWHEGSRWGCRSGSAGAAVGGVIYIVDGTNEGNANDGMIEI